VLLLELVLPGRNTGPTRSGPFPVSGAGEESSVAKTAQVWGADSAGCKRLWVHARWRPQCDPPCVVHL